MCPLPYHRPCLAGDAHAAGAREEERDARHAARAHAPRQRGVSARARVHRDRTAGSGRRAVRSCGGRTSLRMPKTESERLDARLAAGARLLSGHHGSAVPQMGKGGKGYNRASKEAAARRAAEQRERDRAATGRTSRAPGAPGPSSRDAPEGIARATTRRSVWSRRPEGVVAEGSHRPGSAAAEPRQG